MGLSALGFAFTATARGDDEEVFEPEDNGVIGMASYAGNSSTLLTALHEAGLTETLQMGFYTVFRFNG